MMMTRWVAPEESIFISPAAPVPEAKWSHDLPDLTPDGWDTLTRIYHYHGKVKTAAELAAAHPIGSRIIGTDGGFTATSTWWLERPRQRQLARGIHEIELTYKGWAAVKPPLIQIACSGEQQSAQNVNTPAGLKAKFQTLESMPGFTVSTLEEDITTASKTGIVGKESVDLALPPGVTVANSVWTSLSSYVYSWPNGWVLADTKEDRLPGCNAAYVTDSYRYIRDKMPG